jgi:hypothetical protein
VHAHAHAHHARAHALRRAQVVAAHARNVLRFVRDELQRGADAVCLQARRFYI